MSLAWLVTLGIVVQAALAGQGWFVTPDLLVLHGGVGHGVLTLAVVLTVAVVVRHRVGLPSALSLLLVIGLVAQTGLGYAGRRGELALASSVHIPLGVIVLGLAVALVVWLSLARRTQPDTAAGGA